MRRPGARFYRFFGGKGGVGKTTLACAVALSLVEEGRRVLLVSTDPAHSLSDALCRRLAAQPRAVALPGREAQATALYAAELDADRALSRWLAAHKATLRLIAERGTYLDDEDIDRFLSLSLPGVDELMGLYELTRLGDAGRYDEVVVDTAPTGHTLRLLSMPETISRLAAVLGDMHAKHRFLAESLGGLYRPDRADALIDEIDGLGRDLRALLCDPARCAFTWVLLPEALSVEETADGLEALADLSVPLREVIVNRVQRVAAGEELCARCERRRQAEQEALAALARVSPLPPRLCYEQEEEPRGPAALLALGRELRAAPVQRRRLARPPSQRQRAEDREDRPAKAPRGRGARTSEPSWQKLLSGRRLLLFGGKGGVGKTTCAAAAALALAEAHPARRVLLLSVDPAHSLSDVLSAPLSDEARALPGGPKNLFARELDAAAAFARWRERYREAVDALSSSLLRGANLDIAYDRAVVEDLVDLAPPGLDELFALLALITALEPPPTGREAAREESYDLVVLDTAPTGHTLRLLAMPEAALSWVRALLAVLLKYRRVIGLGELATDLVARARELRRLMALLQDPSRAEFVVVTRAAELPRRETRRLLEALGAARLAVAAVLVNAVSEERCARCRREGAAEAAALAALGAASSRRGCALFTAPALWPPPRGVEALLRFSRSWKSRRPGPPREQPAPRRSRARSPDLSL